VSDPHAPDTGRRDRQALLGEFVGDAMLPSRRLVDRQGHDGVLKVRADPVSQIRLRAIDLLQRLLATRVVQYLTSDL
jgi:hypothetical protein